MSLARRFNAQKPFNARMTLQVPLDAGWEDLQFELT
jgi:hypothetical protein